MSVDKKSTPKNGSPVGGEPPKKKDIKPKLSGDKKKIQDLKKQVSELEERRLRLKAEFENFRKRRDKDMLRMLEYEGEEILKKLLPIVDDLKLKNILQNGRCRQLVNPVISLILICMMR